MPLVDLMSLPARGALIGIDPGSKTLGVAVCDPQQRLATPVETIPRGRKLAPALAHLFDLMDARAVVGVVLGLPLNMDGSSGPRAQAARALGRSLLALRDLPMAYQDERLTTAQAERDMLAANVSRARRAASLDAAAATLILQAALDRRAGGMTGRL